MKKPLLAIDLDDTLANYISAFVAYAEHTWHVHVDPEKYSEDWEACFGATLSEWREMSKQIADDADWWYRTFEPVPMAQQGLSRLSQHFSLVGVTARQMVASAATKDWLMNWFGDSVSDCYFLGAYDQLNDKTKKMTKGQLCKTIGAAALIDDQPRHYEAAEEYGVVPVLFGSYGWNRDFGRDIQGKVYRMRDWSVNSVDCATDYVMSYMR